MLKQFVWEYRYIIVLILVGAITAVAEWQRFKSVAYAIMLQAKSLAKDKVLSSGQVQEDWVVMQLYRYIPKPVTALISNDNMHKIVHYLFHKAKDFLDDGRINNSIQ